ncbi:hypothetical protein NONO_c50840 [Nocardia nova SH22a]|uniref:Mce-associated membrane protein n=1 Tax=Nocardia nova SH22a TaxID=1415166 RepID=W5TLR1_9NOCA|nr:hypothetical protein [Nocardia nova]AHH19868.1 hypothetical protein NONO_c50840 [Nocardia nova SH22a]
MSQSSAVLTDTESADAVVADDTAATSTRRSALSAAVRRGRRTGESSIKLKTVAVAVIMVLLAAGAGILGWQLHDRNQQIDAARADRAATAHAEQAALDYATAAAEMNFQDLASWRTRLTKGTSPELSNRLTQAAGSMEQIITPLQWVSTAKPVAAKVHSNNNGIYTVDCFVSVLTKNSQAPEGIQSTATYSLTLDSHSNWTITDIGGIDGALGGATPPR